MTITLNNGRKIGNDCSAYIIAEIGINHNGSMDKAKTLIKEAANCSVDAVKFQKRTIDEMYLSSFLEQRYDVPYSFGETYGEHKRFLELSNKNLFNLKEYANSFGIDFLVSGFDLSGFDFIEKELNVPIHKIPSPYVSHTPLLEHIARFNKPLVLSTGMHSFEEVKNALRVIQKINKDVILLQCTSVYPCENQNVNLKVIETYIKELHVLAGFSSHDKGVILPAVSVALGGCIVEKHFTLDRTDIGPDHIASVEPRGMSMIVNYIRACEAGIGSREKKLLCVEKKARIKYGISCVLREPLKKGMVLGKEMILYKVPGTGVPPSKEDKIVGKKALRNINKDEVLHEGDFE